MKLKRIPKSCGVGSCLSCGSSTSFTLSDTLLVNLDTHDMGFESITLPFTLFLLSKPFTHFLTSDN